MSITDLLKRNAVNDKANNAAQQQRAWSGQISASIRQKRRNQKEVADRKQNFLAQFDDGNALGLVNTPKTGRLMSDQDRQQVSDWDTEIQALEDEIKALEAEAVEINAQLTSLEKAQRKETAPFSETKALQTSIQKALQEDDRLKELVSQQWRLANAMADSTEVETLRPRVQTALAAVATGTGSQAEADRLQQQLDKAITNHDKRHEALEAQRQTALHTIAGLQARSTEVQNTLAQLQDLRPVMITAAFRGLAREKVKKYQALVPQLRDVLIELEAIAQLSSLYGLPVKAFVSGNPEFCLPALNAEFAGDEQPINQFNWIESGPVFARRWQGQQAIAALRKEFEDAGIDLEEFKTP